MNIVKYRKFFFGLTLLLVVGSIAAVAFLKLPLSIDFTGGTIIEVAYEGERPALSELTTTIEELALGHVQIRESGESAVTLRTRTLTPSEHDLVLSTLAQGGTVPLTELRNNSIGPSMGSEMYVKALWALIAVILSIMLYIAFAFRKVSKPISSWVFGGIVVLALLHDVLVPMGFFAILSYFTGAQVDTLFVVAILAILGYSVNDTIVIFDRVREHLRINDEKNIKEDFETTVGKSVDETMGRSINTSLTVVLVLVALVIFGSAATFNFALVLLVGVLVGAYSSIFIAAPLLIPIAKKFVQR